MINKSSEQASKKSQADVKGKKKKKVSNTSVPKKNGKNQKL